MVRSKHSSKKPNAKGRSGTSVEKFVYLPDRILRSPAYRSLTPNARALLVELILIYNGFNNGALWLSVDDAAARIGRSDHHSATDAFNELIESGLIAVTKNGYYSVKASLTSRARCFRLTWLFDQENQKSATNDWKSFTPKSGSANAKRMDRGLLALKRHRKEWSQNKMPVVDSTALDPVSMSGEPAAVVESTTANDQIGSKASFSNVVVSTTHIDLTMDYTVIGHPVSQWWCGSFVTTVAGIRSILLCQQLIWLCNGTTSLECAA